MNGELTQEDLPAMDNEENVQNESEQEEFQSEDDSRPDSQENESENQFGDFGEADMNQEDDFGDFGDFNEENVCQTTDDMDDGFGEFVTETAETTQEVVSDEFEDFGEEIDQRTSDNEPQIFSTNNVTESDINKLEQFICSALLNTSDYQEQLLRLNESMHRLFASIMMPQSHLFQQFFMLDGTAKEELLDHVASINESTHSLEKLFKMNSSHNADILTKMAVWNDSCIETQFLQSIGLTKKVQPQASKHTRRVAIKRPGSGRFSHNRTASDAISDANTNISSPRIISADIGGEQTENEVNDANINTNNKKTDHKMKKELEDITSLVFTASATSVPIIDNNTSYNQKSIQESEVQFEVNFSEEFEANFEDQPQEMSSVTQISPSILPATSKAPINQQNTSKFFDSDFETDFSDFTDPSIIDKPVSNSISTRVKNEEQVTFKKEELMNKKIEELVQNLPDLSCILTDVSSNDFGYKE